MLVALVLLVFGVILFDMRGRLKAAEQRLAMLENGPQPREQVDEAVRSAAIVVRERPTPAAPLATPLAEPIAHVVEATVEVELEAAPEPAVDPAGPSRPSFSFEELFGRRLPIWAGGVTLAVAGVLLVKYSIDAGLLSPVVRIVLGLLFGAALIGGAEAALRQEERVRDPRVRQALAGAGLATLYFSLLAAHGLYGLVGTGTAFAGLAGVTALAMGLSLRFGAPSALLGLVGGLAAPALVEAGSPNVPLLSCYLALAVAGLCVLSRTQRWMWLGVSALIGGAGWGVALLVIGALDWASSLSVGLLLLALGVGLPLLAFSGTRGAIIRTAAAVVAAAQMAALVATGGFAMLHWGLFALLSVALVWLGRDAALRPLSAVGVSVALLLAGIWPEPEMGRFAQVMLTMGSIYGGAALIRLWRVGGGLVEAGQLATLALGGPLVSLVHFYHVGAEGSFALLALAITVLPVAAMMVGWRCAERRQDARFALLATTAAALLVVAGAFGLPGWALAIVIAAVAASLLMLAERAQDRQVEGSGWVFALGAVMTLVGWDFDQMARLWDDAPVPAEAGLRWLVVALMAVLFGWRARFAEGRLVAQGFAALLGYGAAAQIMPALWLPVAAALGLVLLAEIARRWLPALGVMAAISLLWAVWPLAVWSCHALLSLAREPMLVTELPQFGEALRRLAVPAAMLAVALWRLGGSVDMRVRRSGLAVAVVMGGVAIHIGYKQIFGLVNDADVVRLALAERVVWEAVLIGLGLGVWRWAKSSEVALWLISAGLGHALVYTVLLHDPLWAAQAVGDWPVANLLLPAFGLPFLAIGLVERRNEVLQRPANILRMLLIALFALASLRQMFVGSVLIVPGLGEGEDILRSVLALGLAFSFLLWGIRTQAHDWRIASLLLMLCAVAKVFLLDASGLTGLLRIASFLALGFSLIGIGWLCNRVLREPVNNSATNAA